MLQYPDLKLGDVSYYWSGSILLRKSAGQFLPCRLGNINPDSKYPIELIDMSTGEKHINLRLETFKHTVLIHHPSLGYGDYGGVPIYLSPRAGREKRKGLDVGNITALCPVNWEECVMKCLAEITEKSRAFLKSTGRVTLPKDMTAAYNRMKALAVGMRSRLPLSARLISQADGRRGSSSAGRINIRSDRMWASVIEQSVNNRYPALEDACEKLAAEEVVGVSVSRDFCLIDAKDDKRTTANVYHRMSLVGEIDKETHIIKYQKNLSAAAIKVLELAINKLRR